jgi:hypothetical protein
VQSGDDCSMFDGIVKGTTGALDKAKLIFNPTAATTATTDNDSESQTSPQQAPDRLEELAEYCPQLTFQQRLIGFAVSFSLGCKLCVIIGTADLCLELAMKRIVASFAKRSIEPYSYQLSYLVLLFRYDRILFFSVLYRFN